VDATQALSDLKEISSQVVDVVILEPDGSMLASTLGGEQAGRFAERVTKLVARADSARAVRGLPDLSQLEVATLEGSVFAVRGGERLIAATTRPDPTVGLVFYDLKHCLRTVDELAEQKAKPRRRGKTDASA